MSVRIAAHAITALALGPAAHSAAAAPDPAEIHRIWVEGAPEELDTIAIEQHLGRDHTRDVTGAALYATTEQRDVLLRSGWSVRSLPPTEPPEGYRLSRAGTERLRELARSSSRAGLVELGTSVEGRAIVALWIGRPPESGAPVHRILGAHHGDEWSSFEVALATAEALVELDGQDDGVTAALDQLTIWIAPYTNPDGVDAGIRWNAHTVDLNRNYDFEWSADEFLPGPYPFSEPETRAIRAHGEWVQPLLGLSLHSGAANFGWVWNHTRSPAPDAEALEGLALRYQANNSTPGFWVTNGAAWYITHGDTNDWSYGRLGVWDSTVELTEDKAPPSFEIEAFTAAHLSAMLDQVTLLPDVSGRVTDASTGLPVAARVQLWSEGDPLGQAFYTEPGTGFFHRLADTPVTAIEVHAPGFASTSASPDELPEIRLERDRMDGRPILPAPAAATDRIELPEPVDGVVVLSRPGHPTLEVAVDFGVIDVDPSELAPGAWTVERPDGTVHPNGLLVSDRPALEARWSADSRSVTLEVPLAEGARAWALFGDSRARLPLPVLEQTASTLTVSAAPFADATGTVDLWILSGSEHLFAPDILDSTPDTWGFTLGRPQLVGSACACGVKTGHLPALAGSWIPLILLIGLRRRA